MELERITFRIEKAYADLLKRARTRYDSDVSISKVIRDIVASDLDRQFGEPSAPAVDDVDESPRRSDERRVQISFTVGQDRARELKEFARAKGTSLSALLKEIVDEKMEGRVGKIALIGTPWMPGDIMEALNGKEDHALLLSAPKWDQWKLDLAERIGIDVSHVDPLIEALKQPTTFGKRVPNFVSGWAHYEKISKRDDVAEAVDDAWAAYIENTSC